MTPRCTLITLALCLVTVWAQDTQAPSLHGAVTDPSGAAVPGAIVQVRGPGGERRVKTDDRGEYAFPTLRTGKYQIRVMAKDFSAAQQKDFAIDRPRIFDVQLAIHADAQVVNVLDGLGRVRADAESNGSAVVMRERQIGALSDDPEELALQLQALAGPAPGPDGGQFYIDGFTGGNLPPKSQIREVRINANPFSPEYDRPGFSRIEVFTKPGSGQIHGQAFAQYDNSIFNSRNPLLTGSTRPPYRALLDGFNIGGPLTKNRTSFTLDFEHRQIHENAFVLATTLDEDRNALKVNQAVATPQSRTTVSPRLDYTLNSRNTLVARSQEVRIRLDNQGVGDFNLASRAYNERQTEHTVQLTETAVLSPRAINETRFQFLRSTSQNSSGNHAPSIYVPGAFFGGGPTAGNSGSTGNSWELTNISSYTKKGHTLKWGGRVRQLFLSDTSVNDFAGTFTFYTLAQYQETLALQAAGYSGAQIVQAGAGPSQFSRNGGTATTGVRQLDAGVFANDDWRLRPNMTVSLGLRYEAQTNLGDRADWAPRVGFAWGLDGKGNRPARTVLRGGVGTFYDRLPLSLTVNRLRYNGIMQQSFLILNPAFFPAIPSAAELQAGSVPQQLRQVAAGIHAPILYQTSLGIDRQFGQASRLSLSWIEGRGVHLLNARNINAPLNGRYPYGDSSIRILTEDAGMSRQRQLVVNTSVNYRKLLLFGYYALSYGKDNNEGQPADPYSLHAEWGPSTYGDLRHRMATGVTIPAPWRFSVNPFLVANSGYPYNITSGLDPAFTGYPAARPALLPDVPASACHGRSLKYASQFGCFNLVPGTGASSIERDYGRGAANWNLALRVARTWALGRAGREGAASPAGASPQNMGAMGSGAPSGQNSGHNSAGGPGKYNLTFSASTLNALNHPNFAPPNGNLSSDYFGQYRSLGGLIVMSHGGAPSTYNRKIDLQLRLTF